MIEVNLAPESQRGAAKKRRAKGSSKDRTFRLPSGRSPWNTALIISAVVVPLAVLALWLARRSDARELADRLAEATADSARLADLRAISDSLIQRQETIKERIELVQQLDQDRFVWPHLLDEISRALPQFSWLVDLTEIGASPAASVQIRGLAANPLTITDFVRNLEASPYVAAVRIVGSQRQLIDDGLTVQAFTLEATYMRPEGGSRTEPVVPSGG